MRYLTMLEAIDKIKKAYHKECESIISKFNISYVDFALIMFFANNKDKCTAREFCQSRNIKPNVVSLHVNKLVNDGYLDREEHEIDRRKIKLSVTSKCDAIVKDGQTMQANFFSSLTNGLSKEDIQSFTKNMIIILDNVSKL